MPNPPTDPDILDAEGLAERLGIAPNTVRKLARTGEIPAIRIGKAWRFYWPAVVGTVSELPADLAALHERAEDDST